MSQIITDPKKLKKICPNGKIGYIGVDLSVKEVSIIDISTGLIPSKNRKDKKTVITDSLKLNATEQGTWDLTKGVYEIILEQSINIPKNCYGITYGRSSLHRCGCGIENGVFEPGYKADNMKCTLHVNNRHLFLEVGSYICQILLFEGDFNKDYKKEGQWKKD